MNHASNENCKLGPDTDFPNKGTKAQCTVHGDVHAHAHVHVYANVYVSMYMHMHMYMHMYLYMYMHYVLCIMYIYVPCIMYALHGNQSTICTLSIHPSIRPSMPPIYLINPSVLPIISFNLVSLISRQKLRGSERFWKMRLAKCARDCSESSIST